MSNEQYTIDRLNAAKKKLHPATAESIIGYSGCSTSHSYNFMDTIANSRLLDVAVIRTPGYNVVARLEKRFKGPTCDEGLESMVMSLGFCNHGQCKTTDIEDSETVEHTETRGVYTGQERQMYRYTVEHKQTPRPWLRQCNRLDLRAIERDTVEVQWLKDDGEVFRTYVVDLARVHDLSAYATTNEGGNQQ